MRLHVRQRYVAILTVSKLILICILACFLIIPLTAGNDDLAIINQANLQVARVEYFAQAVQTLAYRPLTFHSEAVSGMEVNLPVLQQTQNGLMKGDSSLGLPSNPPDDVRMLLTNMQPDYSATVTALKAILTNPDKPPDPLQVDIVMRHTQPYAVGLYQVVLALSKHAEERKILFFVIEIILLVLVLLDVGGGYLFLIRPVLKEVSSELIPAQATPS